MGLLAGAFRIFPFLLREILLDIPFEMQLHFFDVLSLLRSELVRGLPIVLLDPIRPATLGLLPLVTLAELLPHPFDMLFLLRSELLPSGSLKIRPAPLRLKRLPLAIVPLLSIRSPLRRVATLIELLLVALWCSACRTSLLSLPLFLWLPARGYCSCE